MHALVRVLLLRRAPPACPGTGRGPARRGRASPPAGAGLVLPHPRWPQPGGPGSLSPPVSGPPGAPAPLSPSSLQLPPPCLRRAAKVGCEGGGQPRPETCRASSGGGLSAGETRAAPAGEPCPGGARRGAGGPEGVKAARGRSEVRPAGRPTGASPTSPLRHAGTSTSCLRGGRSSEPTPRRRALSPGARYKGRRGPAPGSHPEAGAAGPRGLRGATRAAARGNALLLLLLLLVLLSPQHGSTPAPQTMPAKAALLLALLAALPASAGERARGGLWDYLGQLTGDKAGPEHGRSAKLGWHSATLKGSVQDGVSAVGTFLEKLAPLAGGPPPRLYGDSDSLRKLVRKELESLRVKLSPYVDEAHHQVGRHLEDLRSRLRPLTEELLEQVSLKARELRRHLTPRRAAAAAQLLEGAGEVRRFLAHYGDKLALHTEQVKDIFQPYVERLVTEIHRNVEELHRNVVPHAQAGPEQLHRYVQELSAKLTQNARDLHQQIQGNLEQLKARLSLYPGGAGEPPAPPEELAREVQRRVEEFRRDTYLQIQAFTRALDHETEEMRLKLCSRPSPAPGDPRDGAPHPATVEDLHARLDALWRDLARSLSERGGEAR
ncbi:LOW QUALITY PROTEIN: apolipoprotein A-V [Leptosomus discolor]